jgi:hypothetical protein
MFQDLPSRIESVGEKRGFRSRRFPPGMLEEFVMMSTRGEPDVGMAALIMTSFLRDDVPWLYTMAVELYRASLAEDGAVTRRAYRAFMGAAESLERGPFMHELMGPSGREVSILMHELPRFLHASGRNSTNSRTTKEPSASRSREDPGRPPLQRLQQRLLFPQTIAHQHRHQTHPALDQRGQLPAHDELRSEERPADQQQRQLRALDRLLQLGAPLIANLAVPSLHTSTPRLRITGASISSKRRRQSVSSRL